MAKKAAVKRTKFDFQVRKIKNGFIVARVTSGLYGRTFVQGETYAKDRKAAGEVLQGLL